MAVYELFLILAAVFNVLDRLYVVNNETSFFFYIAFNEIICVYIPKN